MREYTRNEISDMLAIVHTLFEEYGEYHPSDEEELDEIYCEEDKDFIMEMAKEITPDENGCFSIHQILWYVCDKTHTKIADFSCDEVFNSPRLDITVLSYVATNAQVDTTFICLNLVHKRC